MKHLSALLVLAAVALGACAPATPEVITIHITATPKPTSSPEPTATLAPTNTPRPTSTRAPTRTSTATLVPAEATKQAVAVTGTAKAEEKAAKLTATADRVAFLREYERVDIQDFVSYPSEFVGKKIIVMAEVNEIEGTGVSQEVTLWLYSWAGSGLTTAWFNPPLSMASGVREGYKYAVYGVADRCPSGTWYNLDGICMYEAFIIDTSN